MNESARKSAAAPAISRDRAGLPADLDASGLSATVGAFFIWGLLPLYLKALQAVPVLQIPAHRLVWGGVFALGWLALRRELKNVRDALAEPGIRWWLCASTTLICTNWVLYVWGVAANRVVETSLGYFINPLVNVLLGVMMLGERLNRAQWTAVAVATAGVAWLTWSAGRPPWIALVLATSFGLYGLVRKLVKVDSLTGLGTETLLAMPVGLGYLIWCEVAGIGAAGHDGLATDLLLMLGGPLTAVPLVLFAYGARRIPYSTVGLLQYIAPTMQLLLGVLMFHESFDRSRAIGFTMIWTALAIYALDGLWRARKLRRLM
jgi:chloramphenicol-sensitive protein RarD